MKPLFIDTSVLLYAAGAEHPRRDPCRRLILAAESGQVRLHASVEAGQEFLFHRLRMTDRSEAARAFDQLDALLSWHPFTVEVLRVARDLVERGDVRGRDAVHAATALTAGFGAIVAADRDFGGISGLRRVEPADAI